MSGTVNENELDEVRLLCERLNVSASEAAFELESLSPESVHRKTTPVLVDGGNWGLHGANDMLQPGADAGGGVRHRTYVQCTTRDANNANQCMRLGGSGFDLLRVEER
jgi:hypothetical protein